MMTCHSCWVVPWWIGSGTTLTRPFVGGGAEEVRDVVDADGKLTAIEDGGRRPDAGGALDRGRVRAAVHHAPRGVLVRTELDPRDHPVQTDRLERHPERFQEWARVIE